MNGETHPDRVERLRGDLTVAGYRVEGALDLARWATPADLEGRGTRLEVVDHSGVRGYALLVDGVYLGPSRFTSSLARGLEVELDELPDLLALGPTSSEDHPSNADVEAYLTLRATARETGVHARFTGTDEASRWFALAGLGSSPGQVATLRADRLAWVRAVLTDALSGVPTEWALRRPGVSS